MRCDQDGKRCGLGDSRGDDGAPRVDSRIWATFGEDGVDWVDVSLVDGFTLPFRFEARGNCSSPLRDATESMKVVDCSQLSLDSCPSKEYLGDAGSDVDLRAFHPVTGEVAGCYSP